MVKPDQNVEVGVPRRLKLQYPVVMAHAVPFHILKPTLQPAVKIRRRNFTHLTRRHRQRHERRNAVDGIEIDLLKPLLVPTCNVYRPPFCSGSFRRLEVRQFDYFARLRIDNLLEFTRAHTVRTYCNCWHLTPPLCRGTSAPFIRFRILKTICALLLKKGEAVSHRSIPARTGTHTSLSVLSWSRRNPSVVGLPRLRVAHSAVRFHGFRSSVPLGATRCHSRRFAFGYSLCSAAPVSLGWRIPKCPVRAAARRLPLPLRGSLHGSASLYGRYPQCFRYKKRGRSPAPS